MKKRLLALLLTASMAATVLAGCSSSSSSTETTAAAAAAETTAAAAAADETTAAAAAESTGEKYKIALSNSYMGNDWRQIMIKTTEVVAGKEPFASKVELKVFNTENTAEAQAASIDALVEQGYDAILVDAASATGVIPALDRAEEAGVVIVTFDNVVDGYHTVGTDLEYLSTAWATYLVKSLEAEYGSAEGKKVAVDTGLAGSTNGNTVYDAAMKVFDEAGVEVVAEFASEWADGVGQQQIASVLAANPELDAIFTQCYGDTIAHAFADAGRDLIPCCGYDTNSGMLAVVDNNMNMLIGNNCPGLGAIAMDVAVDILDGNDPGMETQVVPGLFTLDTDMDLGLGEDLVKIEEGVNAFRDQPDAMDWPAVPSDFKVQVTIDEIADYQQ